MTSKMPCDECASASGQGGGAVDFEGESPARESGRVRELGDRIKELEQALVAQADNLSLTKESYEREIQKRGQTEMKLRESEERYRAVVEDQSELIARHSPDYIMRFVNDALARYFSTPPEALIGQSFLPLLHQDDRERVAAFYAALSPGRPVGTDEHRVVMNGHVRWHQWNVRALFDGNGRLKGYQSVGRDITDRKRMEESLRESEERYRIVTKHTADGIVVIQDGRFMFVNDAFAYMCGYDNYRQLLGKPAAELIDEAYRGNFEELVNALISGVSRDGLLRAKIFRRDGQELWGEGLHTVIPWNGQPAVLATVRDITKANLREMESKRETTLLRQKNIKLAATMKDRYRLGNIIGKSHAMQQVYEQVLSASASNSNVVLYGESGTGKELVATAIHELSDRSACPFVPVNCGAIPDHLMESEFFGHRKGAFTGADKEKKGYLDFADGGTLFLDEAGAISMGVQVKLLRAIEGGGHTPLGGNQVRTSDFRIISAANRPLSDLVNEGAMREDFFCRIHIVPVYLPPLRDRKEDIILLVDCFMRSLQHGAEYRSLPGKILDALVDYDWPGNVRELQNVLQRYLTVGRLEFASEWQAGDRLDARTDPEAGEPGGVDLRTRMDRYEKRILLEALENCRWNRSRASENLGIPRRTFYDKLKKYGILSHKLTVIRT